MFKHSIGIFLFCFLVIACSENDQVAQEISAIPVEIETNRFDQEFASADVSSISQLRNKYPMLFSEELPNEAYVEKMKDTLQAEINTEVSKAFPSLESEQAELEKFFQHLKYYFPQIPTPKIITLAEEVDYRNKVILNEDVLLISLDNYLGEEHHFYEGFASYLARLQNPDYLISDVAQQYAEKLVPRSTSRKFLSTMVFHGKILYIKSLLQRFQEPHFAFDYTSAELDWAYANEAQILEIFC